MRVFAATLFVAFVTTNCAPRSSHDGGEAVAPRGNPTEQERVNSMPESPLEKTSQESREALRALFHEVAETVAPGQTLELFREIGPTECVDPTNRGLGTHYFTLSYNLPADDSAFETILSAIAERWKASGFELSTERLGDPQPELLASRRGTTVRALAVPGSGRINLAGDTPCLPLDSLVER